MPRRYAIDIPTTCHAVSERSWEGNHPPATRTLSTPITSGYARSTPLSTAMDSCPAKETNTFSSNTAETASTPSVLTIRDTQAESAERTFPLAGRTVKSASNALRKSVLNVRRPENTDNTTNIANTDTATPKVATAVMIPTADVFFRVRKYRCATNQAKDILLALFRCSLLPPHSGATSSGEALPEGENLVLFSDRVLPFAPQLAVDGLDIIERIVVEEFQFGNLAHLMPDTVAQFAAETGRLLP